MIKLNTTKLLQSNYRTEKMKEESLKKGSMGVFFLNMLESKKIQYCECANQFILGK
jgi:hypothetical protein